MFTMIVKGLSPLRQTRQLVVASEAVDGKVTKSRHGRGHNLRPGTKRSKQTSWIHTSLFSLAMILALCESFGPNKPQKQSNS